MDECKPLARGIEQFTMKPVKRAYCFEAGAYTRSLSAQLELSLCPA